MEWFVYGLVGVVQERVVVIIRVADFAKSILSLKMKNSCKKNLSCLAIVKPACVVFKYWAACCIQNKVHESDHVQKKQTIDSKEAHKMINSDVIVENDVI